MAAAAPLPAMSALPNHPSSSSTHNRHACAIPPFDAALLARKLEAHQRHQDVERQQPQQQQQRVHVHAPLLISEERHPSKRASYVPRMAARQFASTTTPMKGIPDSSAAWQPPHRKTTTSTTSQQAAPTSDFSTTINPKQPQAALSTGMSENEILRSAVVMDIPPPRRTSAHSPKDQRSRSISRPPPPPPAASTSPRGYKPGDAAKRNAVKRHSQIVPMPSSYPDFPMAADFSRPNDPPITEEQEHEHEHERRTSATNDSGVGSDAEDDKSDEPAAAVRPKFAPHDRRPDWSQESQCGDDPRSVFHPHGAALFRRKDRTAGGEGEVSRNGGVSQASEEQQKKRRSRQKSAPESRLVTDAVRLIKQEEKQKRRRSLMGFFKRF